MKDKVRSFSARKKIEIPCIAATTGINWNGRKLFLKCICCSLGPSSQQLTNFTVALWIFLFKRHITDLQMLRFTERMWTVCLCSHWGGEKRIWPLLIYNRKILAVQTKKQEFPFEAFSNNFSYIFSACLNSLIYRILFDFNAYLSPQ